MKQTKEKIININEIFQIQSPQDAREFERIAKGRKFCKIGDRIGDICDEELERYYYENSRNIFVRIFKRKKYNKNKMMIESRTTSVIRAIAAQQIRECEDENITREKLISNIKKAILEKVNEYNRGLSKAG